MAKTQPDSDPSELPTDDAPPPPKTQKDRPRPERFTEDDPKAFRVIDDDEADQPDEDGKEGEDKRSRP